MRHRKKGQGLRVRHQDIGNGMQVIRQLSSGILDTPYCIRHPVSGIPFIILLLIILPYGIRGQVAWTKQAGVCFRVEDNQPLERLQDYDSIFSKYNFTFSMSLQGEELKADTVYAAGIRTLLTKGHEFMDFTPSHQTNLFVVAEPFDTMPYHGHPAVDHIRANKVCLKWSQADTTSIHGEGKVNVSGDQVISVSPGEFRYLASPVYQPNLLLPVTGKIYTWKNLQNKDTLNPDTLQIMSFWEEEVNLGNMTKIRYHKLSHFDVKMGPASLKLLGQRTLDICANLDLPRPYVWIQPYGPFPFLTSADVAGTLGATLGYTAGTTLQNDALKCYNEFNQDGIKQYQMASGDFRTPQYSFRENRSLIANIIAKHKVAIDQNYFSISQGMWTSYLKKVDSLLNWISLNNIPVMTQAKWAAMLYDSIPNPAVNSFPLLQVDRDGDQKPDGYLIQDATLITNDGVAASGNRSLEIKKLGSMCFIGGLGGLEKGINRFSLYTRGDSANVINVIIWFIETGGSVSLNFTAGEDAWTEHTATFTIPDSVSVADIDILCQPFNGGFVRISGMTLRGKPRPRIDRTPNVIMTNRQFGMIRLDTVITDPIYPLKHIQVQVSGGNVIDYQLDMTEGTLLVRKPHSFWLGKDSLYVRATNPEGGSDSAWILFEALPAEICNGTWITLQALDTLPGLSWQWDSDPYDSTLTKPQNPQTEARPGVTTHYSLTASGSGGFYHQDTITVRVKYMDPVVLSGLYPACCANSPPVQLYGDSSGGVFSGKAVVGSLFYPKYASTGDNKVYYTVTDPVTGCVGQDSASVTVNPIPVPGLPEDTLVCDWQTVLLDAGPEFDSYLWSTGETTSSVNIGITGIGPDSTRLITLIVTQDGCPGFDTVLVRFRACTGIPGMDPNPGCLKIYPIPFTTSLTIENFCTNESLTGRISDILGNEVGSLQLNPGKNQLDLSSLPSGIYLLSIQENNFHTTTRIIRMR